MLENMKSSIRNAWSKKKFALYLLPVICYLLLAICACTMEGDLEYLRSEYLGTDNTPFNYADGAANIGRIGPGGGKIYYYNQAGFTVEGYGEQGDTGYFQSYTAYYLEAAPENASSSSVQWGAYGTLINGVTTFTSTSDAKASEIGNGRKDTQIIINHLGTTETNRAAQVCAAYKGPNNLNDWFLPSLGELYLYYQSTVKAQKPTSGYFWSSSQTNSYDSWYVLFDIGDRSNVNKSDGNDVRAVRAF